MEPRTPPSGKRAPETLPSESRCTPWADEGVRPSLQSRKSARGQGTLHHGAAKTVAGVLLLAIAQNTRRALL